jgi:drug/metabolite transporter (DMT)-like permease
LAEALQASPSVAASTARAQYRRGALLVAGGALAWSSAGLLVRATSTDPWTTLFWRSVFAFLFLLTYVAMRDRGNALAGFRKLGLPGFLVALSFATSMGTFILALEQTAVANVLIFQAAAPFVAAVLGWIWLGERVSPGGAAAILATIVGIAVMVSDSLAQGRLYGDLLSAVMGITFAIMMVLARRHRDVSMTAATCLATLMTGLAALPVASFAVAPGDLLLLALFGIGQMGLGLIMFTAGVRLIPVADAGLITILEVIAAPVWVWLVFGENPGMRAIIGGSIVLAAVISHTLIEKRSAAG